MQLVIRLKYSFENVGYNHAYGGKPWAAIADTILQFLEGNTSFEVVVDTGYTLAHNTGNIFNKSIHYGHASHSLLKILDIQRSGQIPEMVVDKLNGNPHLPQLPMSINTLRDALNLIREEFPNEVGNYVDWYKVEALGGLGKYPVEKEHQDEEHGVILDCGYKSEGSWVVDHEYSVHYHHRETA